MDEMICCLDSGSPQLKVIHESIAQRGCMVGATLAEKDMFLCTAAAASLVCFVVYYNR
jgi:hypothetical protein